MRTLVKQTRDEIDTWVQNLSRAGLIDSKVDAFTLMGGNVEEDWQLCPEAPAILIGTQDQLLSRALNRGYTMSRRRWPMHFGLLNNDCLWVLDEVQLMGPGLATALQLEAFRRTVIDGKDYFATELPCFCWYMSATANRPMLATRQWRTDFGDRRPDGFEFGLSPAERDDQKSPLGQRRFATKELQWRPEINFGDDSAAETVIQTHQKMVGVLAEAAEDIPRRSLVICNTVDRACMLYSQLEELTSTADQQIDLVLLHSRFRPPDREVQMQRLLSNCTKGGQIVVATQVIEAGVDLSSGTLWSEIAPLPSIIQRLGRLNRAGEFGHAGATPVKWTPRGIIVGIELPELIKARPNQKEREDHERKVTKAYLPYDRADCDESLSALQQITDASPAGLETGLRDVLDRALKPPTHSLLRHELLDFFDTDSNVSLGYTDVSPFIRGTDPEADIYVFWREFEGNTPPYKFDLRPEEICAVPIWRAKAFDQIWGGFVWTGQQNQSGRETGWQAVTSDKLFPGATVLLRLTAGGYNDRVGWTGDSRDIPSNRYQGPLDRSDEDMLSRNCIGWQSLSSHTADVHHQLSEILSQLHIPSDAPLAKTFLEAVQWHDYGKNAEQWQAATRSLADAASLEWPDQIAPVAKFSFSNSPRLQGKRGRELWSAIRQLERSFAPKLRHEVASALALRQHHRRDGRSPDIYDLLAEYLVMSHHGYVRKVLRDELPRKPSELLSKAVDVVRGIQDGMSIDGCHVLGQELPATESLSIECRKMGRCEDGSESWTKGVLRLLDEFGPFRLSYYEAIFRAADWRASANPRTDVIEAEVANSAVESAASLEGAN